MPISSRPLYHSFAWAYDRLVGSPGGPSAAAVARLFLERGIGPGSSIVDAGCGTGRLSIALERLGFVVTGIDVSPELVERARRSSDHVEFVVADLHDWRPPEPADGVLCRGVLNDLVDDADRGEALRGLHRMLRPGGALVLDVREWEASARRYATPRVKERRVRTGEGELVFRSETTANPSERLLRAHERLMLGPASEECEFVMRPWTRDELEQQALGAGFASFDLVPTAETGARGDRIVATATA